MLLQGLVSSAVTSPKGAQVLVAELEGVDAKAMQEAAQKLAQRLGDPAAVVLGTRGPAGTAANFVATFSPKVRGTRHFNVCIVTVFNTLTLSSHHSRPLTAALFPGISFKNSGQSSRQISG